MVTNMILWGVVFAVAVIAELATFQLVSIWFAAGALGAFIAAAAGLAFMPQLIIFTAVSALLLCVSRPLLRKLRVKEIAPTGYEDDIGRVATVTEEINAAKDTGRVKIGGVSWKARTEDGSMLPAGTTVRVTRISGTTAFVASEQIQ